MTIYKKQERERGKDHQKNFESLDIAALQNCPMASIRSIVSRATEVTKDPATQMQARDVKLVLIFYRLKLTTV
ncbi:hypothetical protein NECAME_15726 [Necator americanus]|uniref:Uncharacterized protein n=1 Tax=Necator americanus TaxID=51031 RepID=W2SIA3_NECAM|nr:hypothetical protein NECAME_15726 [Necator americanus]ETN68616.1 hypothetical protein NECAME_15726 [Necator americanus]